MQATAMQATALRAAELFGEEPVLVEANHQIYFCGRDRESKGWRCGRCELGLFVPRPGESVPRPGRACRICQAEVCVMRHEWPVLQWRGPVTAILVVIVSTWPLLFWWALL